MIFIPCYTNSTALNPIKHANYAHFVMQHVVSKCSLSTDSIHNMLGKAYCDVNYHDISTISAYCPPLLPRETYRGNRE